MFKGTRTVYSYVRWVLFAVVDCCVALVEGRRLKPNAYIKVLYLIFFGDFPV